MVQFSASKTTSHGFTLMEVLIALVVISIGLFGIAGMQLQSLKTSHDAYLRSQATYLAYDLIDKMRANRTAAIAGAYDTDFSFAPSGGSNCYSNSCSVNNLAQFERDLWKCELGGYSGTVCNALNITPALTQGEGSVDVNSNQVTVNIRWEDSVSRTEENAATLPSLTIVATL